MRNSKFKLKCQTSINYTSLLGEITPLPLMSYVPFLPVPFAPALSSPSLADTCVPPPSPLISPRPSSSPPA